jgi:hypothetical protein
MAEFSRNSGARTFLKNSVGAFLPLLQREREAVVTLGASLYNIH